MHKCIAQYQLSFVIMFIVVQSLNIFPKALAYVYVQRKRTSRAFYSFWVRGSVCNRWIYEKQDFKLDTAYFKLNHWEGVEVGMQLIRAGVECRWSVFVKQL
jgi:hypothetical protein